MIELTDLANINYPRGIHIELEFIILKFLCFSVLRSPLFFSFASLCFRYAFSTPNLCSNRFAFFGSAFSSSDYSGFSTPNLCFSSSNMCFSDRIFQIVSSSSFRSGSSILQIFIYFSSLRNSSSLWINYSISALELESLRLDFVTELKF